MPLRDRKMADRRAGDGTRDSPRDLPGRTRRDQALSQEVVQTGDRQGRLSRGSLFTVSSSAHNEKYTVVRDSLVFAVVVVDLGSFNPVQNPLMNCIDCSPRDSGLD